MNFYDNETYGEHVAEVYDDWFPEFDPDSIAMLARLAGEGKALELGIGTGRIALPMAERNVAVQGLDAAASMVRCLKAKPGGDNIPVHIGNFADVAVEGEFSLIYVVFNTFFALATQEEQVRCFRNAAAHLGPGGC